MYEVPGSCESIDAYLFSVSYNTLLSIFHEYLAMRVFGQLLFFFSCEFRFRMKDSPHLQHMHHLVIPLVVMQKQRLV